MQLIKKLFTGAVGKYPLARAVSSAMMVEAVQECLHTTLAITKEQAVVVSIKDEVVTIATAQPTISMIINMKKNELCDALTEKGSGIKISRFRFLLGLTQ